MAKRDRDEKLLTPEEAAERLRITVRQLHKKRRLGMVEGIKLGHRTIVYAESAIDELAQRMRQSGPSPRRQRSLFAAGEEQVPARF